MHSALHQSAPVSMGGGGRAVEWNKIMLYSSSTILETVWNICSYLALTCTLYEGAVVPLSKIQLI